MRSANSFGVCKNCGRQVMWIRTKAGKNMPVNPQFVNYLEVKGGRERIVTNDGRVVAGEKCDPRESKDIGYISHFATCMKRRK